MIDYKLKQIINYFELLKQNVLSLLHLSSIRSNSIFIADAVIAGLIAKSGQRVVKKYLNI